MSMTISAANGATEDVNWQGGEGNFVAQGGGGSNFDGGSVALQFSVDGGATWINVGTDTTFTANGGGIFKAPVCKLRGKMTGGTTPDVDCYIRPV